MPNSIRWLLKIGTVRYCNSIRELDSIIEKKLGSRDFTKHGSAGSWHYKFVKNEKEINIIIADALVTNKGWKYRLNDGFFHNKQKHSMIDAPMAELVDAM